MNSAFDNSWKEEVDRKVSECSISQDCGDGVLDREIKKKGVCIWKHKNNKTDVSMELLKYGGSGFFNSCWQ